MILHPAIGKIHAPGTFGEGQRLRQRLRQRLGGARGARCHGRAHVRLGGAEAQW